MTRVELGGTLFLVAVIGVLLTSREEGGKSDKAESRRSAQDLFTQPRRRGILRSSSNRISANFRIAPVLCNRSSYVEYRGAEPDVHKTLIIPLGCIYGPSYGVGPPDRGCGLPA
jgi:hypothetical protein